MGKELNEIAQELKNSSKKVQLIFAFNGTGKTRLSMEFKKLLSDDEQSKNKMIYYNAYTEDLFSWDNDLENNLEPKLNIQPNGFTDWILKDQGKEREIINKFQKYTSDKLSPKFNEDYSNITFSYTKGNDESIENIKISKGEESNLIWCVFYSLFDEIISVLNVPEKEDRETNEFDDLKYIFIDDPVSSLDENHLIELAVDLAELIKSSESDLKFIITTHNALFYNILANEFNNRGRSYKGKKDFQKYRLEKNEDGLYELKKQNNDSPFSYHLYILKELKKAIEADKIKKYHFNLLRQILEKLSTFLGYGSWKKLLEPIEGDTDAYYNRIINLYSHSKHSMDEVAELRDGDKRVLKRLVEDIIEIYKFKVEGE